MHSTINQELLIDKELLAKYDVSGPRYTSYPTALQFNTHFKLDDYIQNAECSNRSEEAKPLSLYIHIPFCKSLCYYCGCHKVITQNRKKSQGYLKALYKEITMQAALFDSERKVKQIHLGGGTPTFLSIEEISALLQHIKHHFTVDITQDCEIGIEIDPRTTSSSDIYALASIGFNRMSFGIQDFDNSVQIAINRIQDKEKILNLFNAVRSSTVESLSVDLIYGLPKQNRQGFGNTLTSIIAARPDRIALYNYAHMPSLIKAQKLIKQEDLPSAEEKLELLSVSVETLTSAGYRHIGMDHFALPTDPLSISLEQDKLQRNFQGYSTNSDCDVIGLGVSSISKIGNAFAQNYKGLPDYQDCINRHQLATQRGYSLSTDDKIRADLIQHIMCSHLLNFKEFGDSHNINFRQYFIKELGQLEAMGDDGLVIITQSTLKVTEKGRMLLRNIAMIFDTYLSQKKSTNNTIKYSKVL